MNWALAVLTLLAGLASALVPVVNAEALAAGASGASRAHRDLLPVLVVLLAAGQTIGKLILFDLAGRGHARLAGRTRDDQGSARTLTRIAARPVTRLRTASAKVPVVAVSALTGLPPLAAVAVAAGTTHTSRSGFAAACFAGRTARFALIAYGLTFLLVH
jgi:membrane protein YqaA with SNARE-associated domain